MQSEQQLPQAHLGYVMRDVVHDMHIKVVWCAVKHLRKSLRTVKDRVNERWAEPKEISRT